METWLVASQDDSVRGEEDEVCVNDILMTDSENHFNDIASDYDYWKNHNRYYYQNLFILYGSLIPRKSSVIEIGCGTGDIISGLDPSRGVGIDISEQMINVARKKHADKSSIHFVREDVSISKAPFEAEYVFLADVLEHVDNLPKFLNDLSARVKLKTKVIISVANPIWEPVLMLAERLKMKMPEGPHKRYPMKITEDMFRTAGFTIIEKGFRLLIPKRLPCADWINRRIYNNKFMARFGFIVYWVLRK